MTTTLADVLILTGLNIIAPDFAHNLLSKPSHRLETRNVGGWKGYMDHHARTGPITDKEHTTFLNMWLERFVFCGKTVGPTNNMQTMAESLPMGSLVPIGKHLLGSIYSLLHQVFVKLSTGQPIGNLAGSWWFYEFYYPAMAAQQLGLGQMPIHPIFAKLVKPKELVGSSLEYGQLKNLMPNIETINLEGWTITPFATKSFHQWWSEWCSHLFVLPQHSRAKSLILHTRHHLMR